MVMHYSRSVWALTPRQGRVDEYNDVFFSKDFTSMFAQTVLQQNVMHVSNSNRASHRASPDNQTPA